MRVFPASLWCVKTDDFRDYRDNLYKKANNPLPMLDINLVREQPDLVKSSERKRSRDPSGVAKVLELDQKWRQESFAVEKLKQRRNTVSEEINQAKKSKQLAIAGKKIEEMKEVAAEIKAKEEHVVHLLSRRNEKLLEIGNIMHDAVPFGKDDSQNVELKTWGKKPQFTFPVKNHVELAEALGIADFDTSTKTSGEGFYFLKGALGILNMALIRFALDFMLKKKYTYIEPPLMIRKDVLAAAVDVNEFAKTIYSVEGSDLVLIGTSEHALLGLHANEAIPESELPKKYFAYSMCFRKEVGAHGINEKGIWRRHQFHKVEQFIFCKPEESEKYFEELLRNSEEILQALQLPYRVIEICSGDLSLWKQRSFDLEVWRPTTENYGEVMSLSNCTDYQARKLNIKIIGNDGTRRVVHTLNNTALATSRIMVAILENYQTSKGTVKIPKVLVPYMGGMKEIGMEKRK